MVAYSSKPSFAEPIRARTKRQTIRNPRKRHAHPGEEIQLFQGMRTRNCIRLGAATATAIYRLELNFAQDVVTFDQAITLHTPEALDDFARRDGFCPNPLGPSAGLWTPWTFMKRWWFATHGELVMFHGVLIDWGDTFQPADAVSA